MDVTGGSLNVSKSWWYLVEYIWRRGKWVANDTVTNLDLVTTSPKGEEVSLKRLYVEEASKILGA